MAFLNPGSDVWSEISSLAKDEGLELYELEKKRGNSLDVVIAKGASEVQQTDNLAEFENTSAKSNGVTIDDCTRFSRRLQLSLATEASDFGLEEDIEITVSSPGVNRNLRLAQHYAGAIGQRIKVSWFDEGNNSFKSLGILNSFDEGSLSFKEECSGEIKSLKLSSVKSANVEYKF